MSFTISATSMAWPSKEGQLLEKATQETRVDSLRVLCLSVIYTKAEVQDALASKGLEVPKQIVLYPRHFKTDEVTRLIPEMGVIFYLDGRIEHLKKEEDRRIVDLVTQLWNKQLRAYLVKEPQNLGLLRLQLLVAKGADTDTAIWNSAFPYIPLIRTGLLADPKDGFQHGNALGRVLIMNGANVNKDEDWARNDTALIEAATRGNCYLVKLLIAAGAKVNQGNSHGITPLGMASHKKHREVVAILKQAGAKR